MNLPRSMIPPSRSSRKLQETEFFPVGSHRKRSEKHTEHGSSIPGRKTPYQILSLPDNSVDRNLSGRHRIRMEFSWTSNVSYTDKIWISTYPYGISPETVGFYSQIQILRKENPGNGRFIFHTTNYCEGNPRKWSIYPPGHEKRKSLFL